ncbi:hypothetical protein WSK_3223 [Novosphingobium sp. Rr 2-17]|uniref:hypothetical protein n=1 Tax=Novosphingobium sp. Rr 2-17 TaxID=555793 RepID=UPI00026988CF|nr:hypothetical protein [Novosphingobium sp. Rr 2-17]EIZ78202.1 hypothetical protein WSK_3223 [Novosphingobium sp. Rr 2-17]
MVKSNGILATFAITALMVSPASAQPAPAIDEHAFEGTWVRASTHDVSDFILGIDLPYKTEAQNIAAEHLRLFKEGRSVASAHLTCRPTGVQGVSATKGGVLMLATPREIVMVFQEDREVRHIFMDQSHPKNLMKSYSGHSVGHWEGKTLVVDTVGYNERGQLDEVGNPHSDQLHVLERWTPSEDGNALSVEFTFSDPVYYTQSFSKTREYRRAAGQRIGDYDCAENPRSDDFEILTFQNDWFKPTCLRPVNNGLAAEKVVCTPVRSRRGQ